MTELLGYFLHLENYKDSRNVVSVGWKLFIGEDNISEKPKLSLEEAIWLREKAGMSEAVYQEVRLRLLDRILIPPTNIVREENKKHRPELVEYRHGVQASLRQCLSLTLSERIKSLDLSGLKMTGQQTFSPSPGDLMGAAITVITTSYQS